MSQDDPRFLQMVAMFQMAAMQQMGKFMSPVSGEIERDLPQAKASIDLIEMLVDKTEGNLTHAEKEFLDKILFELRMNYVDEVSRDEKEEEAGETEKPDSPSEGGSGDDQKDDKETAKSEDKKLEDE